MADDESSSIVSMKVPELQSFLKARDIQIALDGKKRKKAELLQLCKNAGEMKVPKVDEEIELKDDSIKSKITPPGGKLLPYPLSLQFWTNNFTNIPDFRFPDIYHYLVMRLVYGRIKAFEVFAYRWTVTLCSQKI